jgi:hypothetical protein
VQTFAWNDERIELVDDEDFLIGEARWLEKVSKTNLAQMGTTDTLVARVIVSLRRRQIFLQWNDFDTMTLGGFDLEDDDVPADDAVPADEDGDAEDPTEPTGSNDDDGSTG